MTHAAPASSRVLASRRRAGHHRTGPGPDRASSPQAERQPEGPGPIPTQPSASQDVPASQDIGGGSPRPAGRDAQPGPDPVSGSVARPDPAPAPSAQLRRSRLAQLPYLIVLAGVAVALETIRQGGQQVQDGTLVLAGVLLAAALARLILPEHRAGMLTSRRRSWDVAIFAVLGLGLLVAGLVLPVRS